MEPPPVVKQPLLIIVLLHLHLSLRLLAQLPPRSLNLRKQLDARSAHLLLLLEPLLLGLDLPRRTSRRRRPYRFSKNLLDLSLDFQPLLILLEEGARGEDGESARDLVVGVAALAEAGEEGGREGGGIGGSGVGGAMVDEGETVEERAVGRRESNHRA